MGRGRRIQWTCCPLPNPVKWLRKSKKKYVEQEAGCINASACKKCLKDNGRIRLKVDLDNGRLHVSVQEAKDLIPINSRRLANPYVKVKLIPDDNNTKVKSKTVRQTLNPVWNKSFAFDLRPDDYSKRVSLEVWDRSRRSRNGFMGSLSFAISEIAKEKAEGWFKLLNQEEGEFYGIPVPDKINKMANSRKQSSAKSTVNTGMPTASPSANQNMSKQDTVRPSDFNFLTVLGIGSFGKVMLAEKKGTDELYAIKIVKKDVIIKNDYINNTMVEKRILVLAQKPPFFVQLHSCFQTMDRVYFVMEYVNGGDLQYRIMQEGKLKESVAKFYAAEVAVGLFYLHTQGIIYRDLKSDNIMLDSEGHIKITDFGMCKEGIIGDKTTKTFCGSPECLAPELVLRQHYGKSVDWWAYGVLLYEMLTGECPFYGDDNNKLFISIRDDDVFYPISMSSEAVSFCQGLFIKDATKRLGCGSSGEKDVKDHAFFKRIDWKKLENREVKPPYKPKIHDPKKAENFDTTFTQSSLKMSSTDSAIIKNINSNAFRNFSFCNRDFQPH